jgi:hypothetical protein
MSISSLAHGRRPMTAKPTAEVWPRTLWCAAVVLALGVLYASFIRSEGLPILFLGQQDLPVVVFAVTFYVGLARWQDRLDARAMPNIVPSHLAWGVFAILLAGCWFGHVVVMNDYALSRDEQMVLFDAQIFNSGHLAVPLPEAWRGMLKALNDNFYFHLLGEQGLVSDYRPVNALIHALFLPLGMFDAVGPALAGAGLFASWHISKQIWPGEREAQVVVILLYATSAQIWATGMTSYAMNGHLALNMIWLALFMRGGKSGHFGALAVGFLATGLHQLPYHPMFAAPFIALLGFQHRWRLGAIYTGCYALFFLLWNAYSNLPMLEVGAMPLVSAAPGNHALSGFMARLRTLSIDNGPITAANLVRFFAWQNLLLLPLLLVGVRGAIKRRNGLLNAMTAALILVVVAKFFLYPFQGHGWGYRYGHGLIGIACLLAASGWVELRARALVPWSAFSMATLLTTVASMPWLLWQAHHFNRPYAMMNAKIAAMNADMVVVDARTDLFEEDLVHNRADMSNRPVRLLARYISPRDVTRLCAHGTIGFLRGSEMSTRALYQVTPATSNTMERLEAEFVRQCRDKLR